MYILSIDPGTKNLGISVIEYNIENETTEKLKFSSKILDTRTVSIESLAKLKYSGTMDAVHSLREMKVKVCYDTISKMIAEWQPACVVSEAPYMGRFPQAFGALVECIQAIRQAVTDYDLDLPFFSIDPATVKKAVGVKGNSGDKNAMTKAMNKLFPVEQLKHLDEHAIDSLGVGYTWCSLNTQELNNLYWGK